MIDKATAEHYSWGAACDGWRLVNQPDLSVIQERMPPNTREVRHYHERARQFFYILSGAAIIELNGVRERIGPGQGLEIPPGLSHQIFNESETDIEFLVISQPTTSEDRVVL